jgi:hypothetical protein
MKMLPGLFGLIALLALLFLIYPFVVRAKEVHEIRLACCEENIKVRIVHTQRRYFGSPHFGWGGGGHHTSMEWEGMGVAWERDGRWWPLFAVNEGKRIILGVKQYLVKPVHYEMLHYEKDHWESVSIFPSDLNLDPEKVRRNSSSFLAKLDDSDKQTAESWLDSVLVKKGD